MSGRYSQEESGCNIRIVPLDHLWCNDLSMPLLTGCVCRNKPISVQQNTRKEKNTCDNGNVSQDTRDFLDKKEVMKHSNTQLDRSLTDGIYEICRMIAVFEVELFEKSYDGLLCVPRWHTAFVD